MPTPVVVKMLIRNNEQIEIILYIIDKDSSTKNDRTN